MSRKSLPNLCIYGVFAFSAIKRREKNYLLWVSSIREVTIFISVFHNSRSLTYNLSEIPLHRKEKKYRTECLGKGSYFMILKYDKPVLLPNLTCPRFSALSNVIKTFLQSKKTQTVNLEEQRERPTKSGVPVDKILQ